MPPIGSRRRHCRRFSQAVSFSVIKFVSFTFAFCHNPSSADAFSSSSHLVTVPFSHSRSGIPSTKSTGSRSSATETALLVGKATSASSLPIHDLMDSIPTARNNHLLIGVSATFARFVKRAKPAFMQIVEVVDPLDLAIILSIAFGTSTVFKWFNDNIVNKTIRRNAPKKFRHSKVKIFSDLMCQAGQCAFFSYIGEILLAFLEVLGANLPKSAPRFITVSTYAIWIAGRLSVWKTRILKQIFSANPDFPRNKVLPITGVFYSRLLDISIYLLMAIMVLDLSSVRVGVVIKSFLSVAGLSSIVLGLSLRDPATQILQGTSLLLLDRFRPGEKVKLADGTIGKVISIGWLDTCMAGADDIQVRIPNSEIASKRIYNISRMKRSQVKQKLRFKYSDIDKIPKLISDLKREIRAACPKLVVDGSRPFRVHWRGIEDEPALSGSLIVVVDTHHDIRPMSDAYYDNREKVMEAIMEATKQNNMKIALPSRIQITEK